MGCRRGDLTAVATLSDSLCQGAVHEDTLALGEKTAGLKAAYEALERDMAARRRALEDGLKQVSGVEREGKRKQASLQECNVDEGRCIGTFKFGIAKCIPNSELEVQLLSVSTGQGICGGVGGSHGGRGGQESGAGGNECRGG